MLTARGIKPWFDGERMQDNIPQQMANGIDQSTCVAAFVTRQYMDKVNSEAADNCKMEFQYAVQRKTQSLIE